MTFTIIIALSVTLTLLTFALDWIRRGWAEIVDEAFGDVPAVPEGLRRSGKDQCRGEGLTRPPRSQVRTKVIARPHNGSVTP
jgi:hypothetical protein